MLIDSDTTIVLNDRLVTELSVEKKVKLKSKSRTPDGRKNLSTVRVIQRNLVYVAGLPLNLADEDVCIIPFYYLHSLSFCFYNFLHSVQFLITPLYTFYEAFTTRGLFSSIWEGAKGVYIPNSWRDHSTVSK